MGGGGEGGGPALGHSPSPRSLTPPPPPRPLLATPFGCGEGGGVGSARPLPIPRAFRLADSPPTDPPSPSFVSRIPGDPKSLGRPLQRVLKPRRPRRPAPAPSGHTARRRLPLPTAPAPGMRLARWVKIPNQAQERPRPARPARRFPSRRVGTAEWVPGRARGATPRSRPRRCAPAAGSCPRQRREAEAAGWAAHLGARAPQRGGGCRRAREFALGCPSLPEEAPAWRKWRVRLRAAEPKAVPPEEGRCAQVPGPVRRPLRSP